MTPSPRPRALLFSMWGPFAHPLGPPGAGATRKTGRGFAHAAGGPCAGEEVPPVRCLHDSVWSMALTNFQAGLSLFAILCTGCPQAYSSECAQTNTEAYIRRSGVGFARRKSERHKLTQWPGSRMSLAVTIMILAWDRTNMARGADMIRCWCKGQIVAEEQINIH